MNLPYAHLLLNHWPIIGTLFALGLLMVGLIGNSDELKQASLVLFSLIALLSIPTYVSGNAAAEAMKDIPDLSADLITAHQGAALLAFLFMEITGAVALAALWRSARIGKDTAALRPSGSSLAAVLLLALATSGLMAVAGNTGGDIRHAEILSDTETSSVAARFGVTLTEKIHYFVIDYSMWIWPALEDLHFIGLILILAASGVLNLRILGFMKQLPVAPLRRFMPWGIAGFIINVVTGFLFFVGMPPFYVLNFVFQMKLLAIVLAGTILIFFYCTGAFRAWERIGPGEDAPPFAKFIAATSIFLWIAVVILGRYLPFGEVLQ